MHSKKKKHNSYNVLYREYVSLRTKNLMREDAGGDQYYYGDSSYGMYSAGSAEKEIWM
jgi:hypothetical protein